MSAGTPEKNKLVSQAASGSLSEYSCLPRWEAKNSPMSAGWFHFKLSATSICLFHSGFLHGYDTAILFQTGSTLKKCSFPSTMFTPDVPNGPAVFQMRGTHRNPPTTLPSLSALPNFGKINTIPIVSKNLQWIGFALVAVFQGNIYYPCDFLWIVHERLSTTTLPSWCRILQDSLLRFHSRRFIFFPPGVDWLHRQRQSNFLSSSRSDVEMHGGACSWWE